MSVLGSLGPSGAVTQGFDLSAGASDFAVFGPFPRRFLIDRLDVAYGGDVAGANLLLEAAVVGQPPGSDAEFRSHRQLLRRFDSTTVNVALFTRGTALAVRVPLYLELPGDMLFLAVRAAAFGGRVVGAIGLELRSQAHRRAVELALEEIGAILERQQGA